MKKDWLEEKLKEKLNDYPSSMDLEASWAALADRREEKKKRGFFFWFLGTGMVLILGTGLALGSSLWQMEQPRALSFFPVSLMDKTPTVQLSPPIAQTNMAKHRPTSPQLVAVEKETRGVAKHRKNEEVNNALGSITPALNVLPENSEEDEPEVQEKAVDLSQILEIEQSLSPLNSLIFSPSTTGESVRDKLTALSLSRPFIRRKKQGAWWLGFSGTVGAFQRQLKGINEMDQALVDRRLSAEKPLEAWSFSLDIRKDFAQRFFLQSGLRHQLSYESFTDQYEKSYEKILEDQVTQIIQRADGSTSEVRGALSVQVKETTASLIYNQQSLTEIPVLVGMNLLEARKSGVSLSMGGIYGLIQRKDGKAFSSLTSIGEYESLQTLHYRSASVWGGQIQMSVYQEIAPQFQFFGGIQLKSYLNMTEQKAYFSERQHFLNLALGLRFRLQ